jgi:acetylornithine/succinyldiaminopimelate/putrescine aminotransferase
MLSSIFTEDLVLEEDAPWEAAHQDLIAAMVPDTVRHPERTRITLSRVLEIVEIIAGGTLRAEVLSAKCQEAAGPKIQACDGLPPSTCMKVAALLTETLSADEVARTAALFWESELSTDEVVALHRKFKIPVSHLEDDLLPVKGEGARVYDSKGTPYVDLDSNYSATNLGNANPEIAQGLFNQASLLISQKEDRIQVARARFLKEIGRMFPGDLCCFYWQNSGGEAVDKALKIAKAYTGQTGVVAFEGGFHGRTHGAVSVTHNPDYRLPFGLEAEPWVHFVPFNDANAVEAQLSEGGKRIVILELVQGEEGGVRGAAPDFVRELRALCDRYEALLIIDEVQTGFGRVATGKGMWFASQVYGIVPDLLVVGKSFGGGYPVTAVVAPPHISGAMKPGYDGSTFGGNPMAMTAALIATRQMKTLNLTVRTAAHSARFEEGLSKIASPLFKGFRAYGLMIGVDLASKECVGRVQKALKKYGIHSSLSTGATMRWMPPLVVTREEVEQVLEAFAKALKDVESA